MANDKENEWKRRSVDRAEEKAMKLEQELHRDLNKYGITNFFLTMKLSQAYIERARERARRGQATPEDISILNKVDPQ